MSDESTAWGGTGKSGGEYSLSSGDWRFQAAEFAKGAAEMTVEFGKGVRDVVNQSLLREDSAIVRKLKGPCVKICGKLRFLNEYLPEDRDPVRSWTVISFVWVFTLAALLVNSNQTAIPSAKKMKTHPPSANLVLLPDGRRLAYQEQGVSFDQARYSLIAPHSFLSSRLAGIPGVKNLLLQEFGIRLVTYDLPGFGESDPHPGRNLESSAIDMLHLSYAVNITGKFWLVGFSDGSVHAWAALRYIPDKVEGAIMVAPMVNPYDPRLAKDERRKIWGKWTMRRKMMYLIARKFPKLLAYFYRRSFLSENHGQIDKWLSFSLGEKDRVVVKDPLFKELWQRDVEESVRQENVKPFVEEAALQVSDWGFSVADIKPHNRRKGKGILFWLKSVYSPAEERSPGYFGSIHVWQGGEDTVIPPAMSEFVGRVLPDVMMHKLPYEGHFTYFYLCDECHLQMIATVFGDPEGPLDPKMDQIRRDEKEEEEEEEEEIVSVGETVLEKENLSSIV